jgi:SAM-dependent methyltransferase
MATTPFQLKDHMGQVNYNFGCGLKPLPDFINVDFYTKTHADEIIDLDQPLPMASASADLIFADNVFEHIKNYLQLIEECLRVLKPGGKLIVKVPYFRSKFAFVDPTHCNFFTLTSMDYFVQGTYNNKHYAFFEPSFRHQDIHINDGRATGWRRLAYSYCMKRQDRVENSILSMMLGIESLTYVLTK